jgi:hypothetical protein
MLLMLGLLREVVDKDEEVDERLLDHVETEICGITLRQ